jgi:3-hydroxymyristoyl/3-hydroxydecanoyl-(acyl carrier protein) dehydratase
MAQFFPSMNKAAHWTVPDEHPVYAGHFPGTPIIPGVLLLDMAMHSIAAAAGIALDGCTINSVKFLSPAIPGDELTVLYDTSAGGSIHFDIVAGASGARKIANGSIVPGWPQ